MAFALLDLVFPPLCVRCRAYLSGGSALCAACRRRVVLHRTFFCGKCRARRYGPRGICHRGFPYTLGAAGEYADPALRALIHSLKFRFVRDAAVSMGGLLADYARRLRIPETGVLVLPVPLSRKRLRERGYNQAELISRQFARGTNAEVSSAMLMRKRHTLPQSGLRGKGLRTSNVAGCFALTGAAAAVAGRKVILLDDVVTTGATLLEAALVLRSAGARDILALTAAKA
jgi:ComF family protein